MEKKLNGEDIEKSFKLQFEKKFKVKGSCASYRLKKLKQMKTLIVEHKTMITKALQQDFQKPSVETDLTEILPVLAIIFLLKYENYILNMVVLL